MTTSTSTSNATPTKPVVRRRRRHDRNMSMNEMRRLMDVYGPLKCLRRRPSAGGKHNGASAKEESIKRKFYRWFPDLDERFEESSEGDGRYSPKYGHDVEIQYRSEMRARDGVNISKKRTKRRKERFGGEGETMASAPMTGVAPVPPAVSSSTFVVPDAVPSHITFGVGDASGILSDRASDNITVESEPVDSSFVAKESIFDVVEQSFYGSDSSSMSSTSSSEAHGSSASWESDAPGLEDMLNKSMEECYEEILGSDHSATMDDGFLFETSV